MLRIKGDKSKERKPVLEPAVCNHCGKIVFLSVMDVNVKIEEQGCDGCLYEAYHYSYVCPYCSRESSTYDVSSEFEKSIREWQREWRRKNAWWRKMWDKFVLRLEWRHLEDWFFSLMTVKVGLSKSIVMRWGTVTFPFFFLFD